MRDILREGCIAIGVQGRVKDRLKPGKLAVKGIWRQVGFLQEGGVGQEGVGGGGTSTPAGTRAETHISTPANAI